MIYYTGDIHGQKHDIERFCKRFNPTREDIIVILGERCRIEVCAQQIKAHYFLYPR